MIGNTLTAYLHYLGFMFMFASLVIEHLAAKDPLSSRKARQLALVDLFYVVSAAVVLITGLLRVMFFGKGAVYYLHNWIFHLKVSVFVVVALVSIAPTVQILALRNRLKNGSDDEIGSLPLWVIMLIRFELLGVTLIPLLAVLMARGVGQFSKLPSIGPP